MKLTLDTNCLLDLVDERPAAPHVRELVRLHRASLADVAITGISASERQRGDRYIENFAAFQALLTKLGLEDLPILKPIGVYGVAFYEWCVYATDADDELRDQLRAVLFPELPTYREYCEQLGLDSVNDDMEPKYRNKSLDVLILHTHIRERRNVFVTSDRNFHKESRRAPLEALGVGQVLTPAAAVHLLTRA